MSLVDCEGFLPPDEPDVPMVRCGECGREVWAAEEELTRGVCGDCSTPSMKRGE